MCWARACWTVLLLAWQQCPAAAAAAAAMEQDAAAAIAAGGGCAWVTVSGFAGASAVYSGKYDSVAGESGYDRAIFKQREEFVQKGTGVFKSHFLFYEMSKGKGFWMMGPAVGQNNAAAAVVDEARHPEVSQAGMQ